MKGLFVGLATFDFIYLVADFPASNQKIVALDQCITVGGPAANAAIAFQHFNHTATWMGVLGQHPISQFIKADLQKYSVNIIDLDLHFSLSPPVSSVIVAQKTGERAVISINATKKQGTFSQLEDHLLEGVDILLIDGHQMAISHFLAQQAKDKKIPIVIDGGSWKRGFDKILPLADYVICSANFYLPNSDSWLDTLSFLESLDIENIAITKGNEPIHYSQNKQRGKIEISPCTVVDTLGAGDIFHGAFCHFIFKNNFLKALQKSSEIASLSCKFLGTKEWLKTDN